MFEKFFLARAQREINRQISRIIKKTQNDDELTIEEEALLQKNPKVFDEISRRNKRRKTTELRKQEIEDSPTVLAKKCDRMAKAIQKAKYLIGNISWNQFHEKFREIDIVYVLGPFFLIHYYYFFKL